MLAGSTDGDDLIDSTFGETLITRMKEHVGDYKYVESGCEQAMRQLTRVRGRTFFEEDLDAFEAVDDRIVSLESNAAHENTTIEAIRSDEEREAVLAKIQGIVGNDEYRVENEDGDLRPPEYGDVAVLTRTRDFGRELLGTAEEYGLPMAYEGGIELFRTDQAKLLLAWLQILEDDVDRGWSVVLERAGYTLAEIDAILDGETYPENMVAFREELRSMETLGGVARRVFARYGYSGPTADVVLQHSPVGSRRHDADARRPHPVHRARHRGRKHARGPRGATRRIRSCGTTFSRRSRAVAAPSSGRRSTSSPRHTRETRTSKLGTATTRRTSWRSSTASTTSYWSRRTPTSPLRSTASA